MPLCLRFFIYDVPPENYMYVIIVNKNVRVNVYIPYVYEFNDFRCWNRLKHI